MTPPSALRFAGVASATVALVLMAANRPSSHRAPPLPDEAPVAFVLTQPTKAAALAAASHRFQYETHKWTHQKVSALADSLAATVRVMNLPAPAAAPASPVAPAAVARSRNR